MDNALTWLLAGLAVLGLLMLGSPIVRTVHDEDRIEAIDDEPSFLYSQTAASGMLVEFGEGRYELTLRGVSPTTVVFSDRPARDAFSVRTSEFATVFEATFGSDHPNAELIYEGRSGELIGSAIFVLSHPMYDAEAKTLAYNAIHIPMEGMASAALPEEFGSASLFIDDGSPSLLISGTVSDNDGEVLPGVLVTAMSPSSSGPVTAYSDTNGAFSLTVPGATSAQLTFELEGLTTTFASVSHSTSNLTVVMTISSRAEG